MREPPAISFVLFVEDGRCNFSNSKKHTHPTSKVQGFQIP